MTKKEEKKKENDLPPLPNLDINKKDTSVEKVTKKEEKKKENDLLITKFRY